MRVGFEEGFEIIFANTSLKHVSFHQRELLTLAGPILKDPLFTSLPELVYSGSMLLLLCPCVFEE